MGMNARTIRSSFVLCVESCVLYLTKLYTIVMVSANANKIDFGSGTSIIRHRKR